MTSPATPAITVVEDGQRLVVRLNAGSAPVALYLGSDSAPTSNIADAIDVRPLLGDYLSPPALNEVAHVRTDDLEMTNAWQDVNHLTFVPRGENPVIIEPAIYYDQDGDTPTIEYRVLKGDSELGAAQLLASPLADPLASPALPVIVDSASAGERTYRVQTRQQPLVYGLSGGLRGFGPAGRRREAEDIIFPVQPLLVATEDDLIVGYYHRSSSYWDGYQTHTTYTNRLYTWDFKGRQVGEYANLARMGYSPVSFQSMRLTDDNFHIFWTGDGGSAGLVARSRSDGAGVPAPEEKQAPSFSLPRSRGYSNTYYYFGFVMSDTRRWVLQRRQIGSRHPLTFEWSLLAYDIDSRDAHEDETINLTPHDANAGNAYVGMTQDDDRFYLVEYTSDPRAWNFRAYDHQWVRCEDDDLVVRNQLSGSPNKSVVVRASGVAKKGSSVRARELRYIPPASA